MISIEDTLRELIEPYQYGKFDLLERMDELSVTRTDGVFRITNWSDFQIDSISGDCFELGVRAYGKTGKHLPKAPKQLVWGYDGEVFTHHTSRHCFMIVYDSDGNQIVVDPSLGYVGLLEKSSYSVLEEHSSEDIMYKLLCKRFSQNFDNPAKISVIGLSENKIYYIGQNHTESEDVLSLYRMYCLPGEVDSLFVNRPQELPLSHKQDSVFYDLVYQLNEHVLRNS